MLRRSILTEKVARRGYHISREYSVDPLAILRVAEVMDAIVPAIPASMKVTELSDRLAQRDPLLSRRQGTFILDDEQKLVGIITRGDVVRGLEHPLADKLTVAEAGSRNLIVCYPDDILHDAVAKMIRNDIGRLPVVDRENPQQPVGYLGRANVMTARLRRLEEEHDRQPGWLAGLA